MGVREEAFREWRLILAFLIERDRVKQADELYAHA